MTEGGNTITNSLKCRKWETDSGGYKCVQSDRDRCGCWSSINVPKLDEILSDEQKEERSKYIKIIKDNIRQDQAALVLGAGISKPCGMPLWEPLISKMMGYAIQYDLIAKEHPFLPRKDNAEKNRLLKQSRNLIEGKLSLLGKVNALEAAEYVVQPFDTGDDDFRLRQKLEEEAVGRMVSQIIDGAMTPKALLCSAQTGLKALAERIDMDGLPPAKAVMEAGAKMVAAKNSMFAVSYLLSADKGIHRAMTYNYDPLVQEHMMSLYGLDGSKLLTHPGKWGEGARNDPGRREIYHVHGFVAGQRHLEMKCSHVFPQNSGPLILSEDSYYRIERSEAYNWSSSIQSSFLNNYQCVFIGFSAEDFNFRRILRQTGESMEKQKHYLIMTIDDWISNFYEDVCQSCLKNEPSVSSAMVDDIATDAILLLQYSLGCRAAYWKRFNIYPIWTTVEEISGLIASLADP